MNPKASTTHSSYRPDIDGLRAVAILGVLGFHTFPEVVHGGFAGVDTFFVISGYLITGILFKALADERFSLGEFYSRRIRRIFPALALVLGACLVAGWFVLLAEEYTQLGKHVMAASGFSLNLVLWSEAGYFDTAAALKPLLHLWSLGVEEQFYIVWPLLLWLAWKRRINLEALMVCIIAVSFIYCVWLTRTDAVAAFYSPITRFWELGIGGALALRAPSSGNADREVSALAGNLKAITGVLLVAAGAVWIRSDASFPGWRALLPTLGAGFLISAGPRAWINRHVLSQRTLVWIGLLSYPLYLWHWPLLTFARIQSWAPSTARVRLGFVLLSVLLAWLTLTIVERPARRGRGAMAAGLVIAMFGTLSAGAFAFARAGFPSRFPDWLRPYAAYSYSPGLNARASRCWLSVEQPATDFASECLDDTPAHARRPLVFIWGDSHAARLYVGMNQVHGERYRFAQFARDGCAPLAGAASPRCAESNSFVLSRIEQSRPSIVVLFAYWGSYSPDWTQDSDEARELTSTIAALDTLHVPRIIVVGPAPKWERNLPRLVYEVAARDPFHRIPTRMTAGLDPGYPAMEAKFRALVAGQPVSYISLRDLLCNDDGCLTHVGEGPDQIVSWDYGHFTAPGAEYVARHVLPILQ